MILSNNINLNQVSSNLQKELQEHGVTVSNDEALELLSKILGYENYSICKQQIEKNKESYLNMVNTTKKLEAQIETVFAEIDKKDKKAEFAYKNAATLAVSYIDEIVEAETERELGEILMTLASDINYLHNHGKLKKQ
jgi:hypothetical protein